MKMKMSLRTTKSIFHAQKNTPSASASASASASLGCGTRGRCNGGKKNEHGVIGARQCVYTAPVAAAEGSSVRSNSGRSSSGSTLGSSGGGNSSTSSVTFRTTGVCVRSRVRHNRGRERYSRAWCSTASASDSKSSSSSGSDTSTNKWSNRSGVGFGGLNQEYIDTDFDELPAPDRDDPFGQDAETQRRVKLMSNYERQVRALRQGIGAEVREVLQGLNIYVVGSSDDTNTFISGALARTLGYTQFTSAELCLKSTGLNKNDVLNQESEQELFSLERMLLRSFNQVTDCCIGTFGLPGAAAQQAETWPIGLNGGLTIWVEDTITIGDGADDSGSDASFQKADLRLTCVSATGLQKYLNAADQADTLLHDIMRLVKQDDSIVTKKLEFAKANTSAVQ